MNEKVVRLINIIQDKFEIPMHTNGLNILRTQSEILALVNNYWPMDGNYTIEEYESALLECDVPNFVNSNNTRIYLLIEK